MHKLNLTNYSNGVKMAESTDKLEAHLEELKRRHTKLHNDIENDYSPYVTDNIRKLKTQKLWIKDEIYRIQRRLEEINDS